MTPVTDIVELGQLGLKPGGSVRFNARVRVGDFVFADMHYRLAEDPAELEVAVDRTTTGHVIHLKLDAALEGPCMRCCADWSLPLQLEQTEVHEPTLDEELASEYVDGQELDLAGLVRDTIGLALPTTIASPVDERGICTECPGAAERLADLADEQAAAQPDPRWAKLRELDLQALRKEEPSA